MLWNENKNCSLILIDIPIGLPHWRSRLCDVEARKILGKRRGSSVFPAPTREATHESSYELACNTNYKILGKKLSLQAWNISPKIKQVDMLLLNDNKEACHIIRESHPEICFWVLSGGIPMIHNKKTEQGLQERLDVLKKIDPRSEDIYNESLKAFKRKDVAKDDIVDAIAVALIASSPPKMLCTIPENPEKDSKGLPMEIVYSNQYLMKK
jgi:predicted RNase H-like nuclease